MVGQHSSHVQVFEDEPVVGLDQRVGNLMQEMPAHVDDAVMMAAQASCRLARLRDPVFLRDNDFANRRCRCKPVARALGGSLMRATSRPSLVAATRNADKPRSMPTQLP